MTSFNKQLFAWIYLKYAINFSMSPKMMGPNSKRDSHHELLIIYCFFALAALLTTSSTGIVYSCKRCFSNLEKISHNKAALEQLSEEVKNVLQKQYPSIAVRVDAATQTAEVSE